MALRHIGKNNEDLGGCTCEGGPYKHGPEGYAEVLVEIKRKKEEQKNEPGTSVREARASGA